MASSIRLRIFRVSWIIRWIGHTSRATAAAMLVTMMLWQSSYGQTNIAPVSVGKKLISQKNEKLQMIVSTSQNVTLEKTIDVAVISNDAIIQVQPLSQNEVLLSALATGVTQVDLKTPDNETYSIEIVVTGDARELQTILAQQFPMATLNVLPIQQAVIISGQVTADEHVEHVVQIAEQYYPTVINRVEVIGVHTIMLQTQVMEVSRRKLRNLGIDWQANFGNDFLVQSTSGLIGRGSTTGALVNASNETVKFGIVGGDDSFFGLIRALKQNNLAKVLADPTVVAIDGRPASFNSGGEFPILVPAGLGQVAVEFREFGTRLDFVAKVRGDGRIWLEVRPTISEVDPGRSVVLQGTSVPGLRSRFVETAVELNAGETLALAGLLQMRSESETVGLPWLSDIPYLGAFFRSNREVQNEVELLILVTPNFAGAMQPHEVPAGGPGFNSGSPLDKELYLNGYIEVPAVQGNEYCPPDASGMMIPQGVPMENPVPYGLPPQNAVPNGGLPMTNSSGVRSPVTATSPQVFPKRGVEPPLAPVRSSTVPRTSPSAIRR
jgi:pilus assembly protein CpaC